MKKVLSEHFIYHLSTASVLFLSFLAYIKLEGEIRIGILFFSVGAYILLGLVHHYLNHNLFPKIMIEYLLMGLLVASIIFFLLKGGIGL